MKESLILFIGEPRSIYDSCWLDVTTSWKDEISIIKNIQTIKERRNADSAIYASVSPVGSNNENSTIDYEFRNLYSAWCSQAVIEGFVKEKEFKDPSLKMGPAFYLDGYASLNKSGGFGNYFLEHTKDPKPPLEKIHDYISSLSDEYNIKEVFFIYDEGYSLPLIDLSLLINMGIRVTYIKPARPYLGGNKSYSSSDGYTEIGASRPVAYGVNEAFQTYLSHLELTLNEEDTRK